MCFNVTFTIVCINQQIVLEGKSGFLTVVQMFCNRVCFVCFKASLGSGRIVEFMFFHLCKVFICISPLYALQISITSRKVQSMDLARISASQLYHVYFVPFAECIVAF